MELLNRFKEQEIYVKLQELLNMFPGANVLSNESILADIWRFVKKIYYTKIKAFEIYIYILRDHIDRNMYRVNAISTWVDRAENISKQLSRVELLSPEQFEIRVE